MANVHGGNLHHPDTEAIKGRCIRTNFHHYILKCIKCPVDLATAVEERNISQLDIKLQERRLNKCVLKKYREHKEYQYFHCLKAIQVLHLY